MMLPRAFLLTFLLTAASAAVADDVALETDVPREAPNDAVMAGPDEVAQMTHWASRGAKDSGGAKSV